MLSLFSGRLRLLQRWGTRPLRELFGRLLPQIGVSPPRPLEDQASGRLEEPVQLGLHRDSLGWMERADGVVPPLPVLVEGERRLVLQVEAGSVDWIPGSFNEAGPAAPLPGWLGGIPRLGRPFGRCLPAGTRCAGWVASSRARR